MKSISRRLCRLEHRLTPARGPLQRFRVVVSCIDRERSLEGATCQRTRVPGGAVWETIDFGDCRKGGKSFTEEELESWIDSFPIQAPVAVGSR